VKLYEGAYLHSVVPKLQMLGSLEKQQQVASLEPSLPNRLAKLDNFGLAQNCPGWIGPIEADVFHGKISKFAKGGQEKQ
jgi:hypothetical protein